MFILSISKDEMSKIFQKFKSCLDHSSKNAWTIFGQLNSCIIQFLSFFPKKKKKVKAQDSCIIRKPTKITETCEIRSPSLDNTKCKTKNDNDNAEMKI